MNSFAIGLKTRNNLYRIIESTGTKRIEKVDEKYLNLPIDFHVNVWKMPRYMTSLTQKTYIDIGIKAPFIYNRIKLFLPFTINIKTGCLDLVRKIKNETVLNALFNSECILNSDKDSCFSKVMQYDRHVSEEKDKCNTFYLYPIGESNVVIAPNTIKSDDKKVIPGTWLDIKVVDFPTGIKENLDNSPLKKLEESEYKNHISEKEEVNEHLDVEILKEAYYYIRFRIQIKDSGEFIIQRNLSNDFLQSAFSKIELYDLRFNEARNIHDKIKEQYKDGRYFMARFLDAHIFFVGSTKVQVNNGSRIKTDSRIIEPDIWSSYEPPHNADNIFIAHHWKIAPKDNADCCNGMNSDKPREKVALDIFFSTVSPRFKITTVLLYLIVVVLLGGIGSFLATDILPFPSETDGILTWFQNLSYKQWILILMMLYMMLWKLSDLTGSISIWWKER